jgi:citrate synthase
MTLHVTSTPTGLDGIPAADTALSHVDGQKGELIIAGERVGHLAATSSFEGVTARLWTAAMDKPITEAEVRATLGDARERAFQRLPLLMHATQGLSIVDGLRRARSQPRRGDRRRDPGDRRRAGAAGQRQ